MHGLDQVKKAATFCSKVFGVAYAAPATLLPASMDAVVHSLVKLASQDLKRGQTFAIRAHRSASSPLSRREIELKGGSEILQALKNMQVRVDLEYPNVTFHVDLAEGGAYVYDERLHGPEGLPLSSQWKMLAVLDSGALGILAAYAMMRRGCLVELFVPVSSRLSAFASERQFTLAGKLRELVTRPTYKIFTLNLDKLPTKPHAVEGGLALASKELIRAVAVRVAKEKKFKGIIFAEIAGDVRRNDYVSSVAGDLPIFTPLIGLDHVDLLELADFAGVGQDELSQDRSQVGGEVSMLERPESFEAIEVDQVLL